MISMKTLCFYNRALCGHCAGTVRALCGHCAGTVEACKTCDFAVWVKFKDCVEAIGSDGGESKAGCGRLILNCFLRPLSSPG